MAPAEITQRSSRQTTKRLGGGEATIQTAARITAAETRRPVGQTKGRVCGSVEEIDRHRPSRVILPITQTSGAFEIVKVAGQIKAGVNRVIHPLPRKDGLSKLGRA